MEKHYVKVLETLFINHDIKRLRIEKPAGYSFEPGQATEISIPLKGWENEGRPFTFTSLPDDDHLEFTIKIYEDHDGVTNKIKEIGEGDKLVLHEVFGAISYQGPGMFIAGGAGVTPFIAIMRYLNRNNRLNGNKLVFANKTREDIFMKNEFGDMLGSNFINILSDEETEEYPHGFVTRSFIESVSSEKPDNFYVCGPPPMMDKVLQHLSGMNVPEKCIVTEEF